MTQQRCIDYRPPLCWIMLGHVGTTLIWNILKRFTIPCPKRFNIKTLWKSYADPLTPWWRDKRRFKKWAPKRAPFINVTIEKSGSKTGTLFQDNYPKIPNSKIQNRRSTIQDQTSKIRNPRFKAKNPKAQKCKIQGPLFDLCNMYFVRFLIVFQDDAIPGSPEMAY